MSDLTVVIGLENYNKLIKQLKFHEGTKRDAEGYHIAYRCSAGALTIGYGHNLDARPLSWVHAGSRLTDKDAALILAADVADTWADLKKALPWITSPDPVRICALINMAFNMGIGNKSRGLLSFSNTLKLIRHGEYLRASDNMLRSQWARQVGRRAVELSGQMHTGKWQ